MDKFKATIKSRLFAIITYIVLMALVYFVIGYFYTKGIVSTVGNEPMAEFIKGMQFGVFITIQFFLITKLVKYSRAIRSNKKLKLLYIERTDERKKYIHAQIGGLGINISIGGIAFGVIIAGYMNETVFITLLCTLIFVTFIKGALKFYYNRKV